MKYFITLLLLVGSLSSLATTGYRCQMTDNHCGYNGGRYGEWIEATDPASANIQCRKLADIENKKLCTIHVFGEIKHTKLTDYRCQLATKYCGYNGGRYGEWIKAIDSSDAMIQCTQLADTLKQKLCGVNMTGNYGEQFVFPNLSFN